MTLAGFGKPPDCLSPSFCQLTGFEEQSFTKWIPRHNLLQGQSSARTRNAISQNSLSLHSISSSENASAMPWCSCFYNQLTRLPFGGRLSREHHLH